MIEGEVDRFNRGSHFEERLVQSLIVDHKFAEQMVEVLDFNYFGIEYLSRTTKILFKYYDKYRAFPSYKMLKCIIEKDLEGEIVKDQIVEYLDRIKKHPLNGDLEFIKEESLDFCRKRKLLVALNEVVDLADERKYDEIQKLIQKALGAGTDRDLGHDFIEQFEVRMIEEIRNPIATPWEEINNLLRSGGPSGGEICCFAAPTGRGKSHALVQIGATAALAGKTVIHYTLELAERDVGNRYDAYISQIPFDDLIKRKDEVKEKIKDLPGKIIIKSFPTKSATVTTIRNHINRLKMRDFNPDLIIVDYAGIMKSLNNYKEKRFEAECVFEDLRGLAAELNIPFWTAFQTNRDSLDKEIITLQHIAEAFVIAMVCDLFITFNVLDAQRYSPTEDRVGNLHIAKSRLGPDGLIFPTTVNTSISSLKVYNSASFTGSMPQPQSEEERLREALRRSRERLEE